MGRDIRCKVTQQFRILENFSLCDYKWQELLAIEVSLDGLRALAQEGKECSVRECHLFPVLKLDHRRAYRFICFNDALHYLQFKPKPPSRTGKVVVTKSTV